MMTLDQKKAFDAIYHEYHPEVYDYVQRKIQCSYTAEEVVQLTFIKFWNNRETMPEKIDIRVQVFQIAKTVLIDELRKKYSKKNSTHLASQAIPGLAEPVNHDVTNRVNYKDTRARIEKLLRSLPPVRKKVFELSRFDEFSHKEISKILNISTKTVENHIAQALKYIKLYWCVILLLSLPMCYL
jgi:RNA polymerase sigma-70 factor (family 1)